MFTCSRGLPTDGGNARPAYWLDELYASRLWLASVQ